MTEIAASTRKPIRQKHLDFASQSAVMGSTSSSARVCSPAALRAEFGDRVRVGAAYTACLMQLCGVEDRRASGHPRGQQAAAGIGCSAHRLLSNFRGQNCQPCSKYSQYRRWIWSRRTMPAGKRPERRATVQQHLHRLHDPEHRPVGLIVRAADFNHRRKPPACVREIARSELDLAYLEFI
jgi:hypothetical protein